MKPTQEEHKEQKSPKYKFTPPLEYGYHYQRPQDNSFFRFDFHPDIEKEIFKLRGQII